MPQYERDTCERPRCTEVRPGTLGYQRCVKPADHAGDHRSQDGRAWPQIARIIDGSVIVTRDFTIGEITQEESVAVIPRIGGVVVRSLDGEVFVPNDMVTEVAGALLSIVLGPEGASE